MAGLLIILYILAVLVGPVLAALTGESEGHGFLVTLGMTLGLGGFMILVLQPVLAGRFKVIERPFGLDMVLRFHKYMAVLAAVLLIAHPIAIAWGGAGFKKLFFSLGAPWCIWLGKAALVLLLLNAALSLLQTRLGIKFEKWRLAHDILGPLILVLIFVHSLFAGDDLSAPAMIVLWSVALAAGAAAFACHRLLRPFRLSLAPVKITDVRQETPDVWTLEMERPRGGVYDHLPGQFHFLRFLQGSALPPEEHHFTISSSPTEGDVLRSTIKASGDFTARIKEAKPGDAAAVHGPFGRFSTALHPEETDLVFIAGGVGVTPLRAMLRHMADEKLARRVILLYANRREEDIIFREELDAMAGGEQPNLKLVHVLSRPGDDWEGERGHVDGEMIDRHCREIMSRAVFYVCGPPGLAETVLAALRERGVGDARIRREEFTFLS